jgi:hypothetical protein
VGEQETKAAPSSRPEKNDERAVTAIAQSGRQSPEDAAKERAGVQPAVLSGPGTGSRLVRDDGTGIDAVSEVSGEEGETIVTIKGDVYEEFAAPGAPNRKIKRLLFHDGQRVPKSVLARHEEALKANDREIQRLAKLGSGTGHDDDPDNETKEGAGGDGGETKEGARGRTPRRS